MKSIEYTVKENICIAPSVYKMTLEGDTSVFTAPGQFINIKLDRFYLRRPISVCDWRPDELDIIYKVVGDGTLYMTQLKNGDRLDCLAGLGNGFDISDCGVNPAVIGGGVGIPPLYALAKRLVESGRIVTAVLGFNTAREVFFAREFESVGANTIVTTVDGSMGTRGFAADAFGSADCSYVFACGPIPMLKAVYMKFPSCQLSLEERMGCGFGACMGCSVETAGGFKRVCSDGPVFNRDELLWDV
ncbi:MAG: dihydroorotate dehydrogenase electron transfer subunit [Clostridia bacterium]|nr:dihydroorotate dehydrogenase electron transfer subunit [Clostridia bacterium]